MLGKKKLKNREISQASSFMLVQDGCFYCSFLFYCLNPSLLWKGLQHKSYEGWRLIEIWSTRFRVVCMDHTLQIILTLRISNTKNDIIVLKSSGQANIRAKLLLPLNFEGDGCLEPDLTTRFFRGVKNSGSDVKESLTMV